MRKFTLLLSVFAFCLMIFHVNAQQLNRCGTMQYLAKQLAADPEMANRMAANEEMTKEFERQTANMRTSNVVITIPVVFHVLYKTAAQNISDNRIYDQLLTMNKDYALLNADTGNIPSVFRPMAANTNIQFCLAHTDTNGNYTSGIIRKSVTANGYDPLSNDNVKFSSLGGDNIWDRTKYLNIWICNFSGASGQIIGISQFPGGAATTDGCVILYGTVGGETYHGTTPSYNLGRTVTHEVGHWLNLRHIWADDGGGCTSDDYVSDTPKQGDANYGCPAFPHVSCTNGPNGDMFMNYMDYGDDNCLNMFSAGQGNRMTAALNGPRLSIKSSTRCDDVTAISNPSGQIPVSIFPNPSTGEFVISSLMTDPGDVNVKVSNLLGEIVFSQEYKNVPYVVQKIDLSNRVNGIYIVEVRTATGSSTGKLVLSK
jgi:hypothetical protein